MGVCHALVVISSGGSYQPSEVDYRRPRGWFSLSTERALEAGAQRGLSVFVQRNWTRWVSKRKKERETDSQRKKRDRLTLILGLERESVCARKKEKEKETKTNEGVFVI